jgi:hypothetical protein
MKHLFWILAAFAVAASGGTLFLPAYPNALLVFDEAKGQVVERIPLTTGTPMRMRLSQDRKRIYVSTIDHNGIEVVDVATAIRAAPGNASQESGASGANPAAATTGAVGRSGSSASAGRSAS